MTSNPEQSIEQLLDDVDAYCAAATPEPWSPVDNKVDLVDAIAHRANWESDAAFIARARADLPRLSRELRQLLEREQPSNVHQPVQVADETLWGQLLEAVEYIRNDEVHDAALRIIAELRPVETALAASPVQQMAGMPFSGEDFVEKVWQLTQDRDGWSKATLRGLVTSLLHAVSSSPVQVDEVSNDASFILERAAGEPCHRSDYGWEGTCETDAGPDNHYACARCLARKWKEQQK